MRAVRSFCAAAAVFGFMAFMALPAGSGRAPVLAVAVAFNVGMVFLLRDDHR